MTPGIQPSSVKMRLRKTLAMRHLGMPEVRSVRIGKYMEIDIEGQNGELESRLHQLCRDLLSNPVIEDYELLKGRSGTRTRKSSAKTKA